MRRLVALLCTAGSTAAGAATPQQQQAQLLAPGVPFPQGLQGHDDENWPAQLAHDPDALNARYKALGAMQPGIRRYNMFWSTFESVQSAAAPMQCPAGTELHPSGADRKSFHRYHCYRTQQLQQFDQIFKLDESIGAQGGGIFYSAPAWAIEKNCTGFVFGKDVIKGGCAPRDDAMDDYEDFINLVAQRYSPHLKHYIVWNEVASAGWMDCSPHTPNRAGPNGESTLTVQHVHHVYIMYMMSLPVH